MISDEEVAVAIKAVLEALSRNDGVAIHEGLRKLAVYGPEDWVGQFLRKGGMSSPDSKDFRPRLAAILGSLGRLLEEEEEFDTDKGLEILGLVNGLMCIAAMMSFLREKLDSLEFWKQSRLTRIWRLACYVETQSIYARRTLGEQAIAQGAFNPIAAIQSNQHVLGGEGAGTVSVDLALESVVDATEQVLRLMFHRSSDSAGGFEIISPYLEQDFRSLITISSTWRRYVDLWNRIKFSGWLPSHRPEGVVWEPPSREDYMRGEVGNVRERLYVQQAFVPYIVRPVSELEAARKKMSDLVSSIVIPEPGVTWGLNVDFEALRGLMSLNRYVEATEVYVKRRHLGAILNAISDRTGIPWDKRMAIMRALHVLAEGLQDVAQHNLERSDNADWAKTVVAVDKKKLTNLLASATGIESEVCGRYVDGVVFNEKRKGLELWDQHLIPIDSERVVLIPSIVTMAHPVRTIEHLASELSNRMFDVRGTPYEKSVAERLAHLTGATVARGIKFGASDGREVQYDVAVFWGGHAFLLELKCLKWVTSPVDEYGAREEIDRALGQVERRRRLLRTDWKQFCAKANNQDLPTEPPEDDAIHMVALTNIMNFTGMSSAGVAVVDDSVLFRYFGDPLVEFAFVGPDSVEMKPPLMRIREDGSPDPVGFWRYLCAPPQLSWIRERISLQVQPILVASKIPQQYRIVSAFNDVGSKVRSEM
ncbi:hypothetical protein [Corallococcus sp. AS-1-12]|uniref:hypothetical protein n=1 Tax=Corallococcus sp. AS-1-12 TaxID=2874598 RepID=UPI001CBC63CF|nr:hypothetical protein [Corallococcus sp. AS-1-12]MBZ4335066.1 hypothetical protein [Corallococcus sp. AS-1-12]